MRLRYLGVRKSRAMGLCLGGVMALFLFFDPQSAVFGIEFHFDLSFGGLNPGVKLKATFFVEVSDHIMLVQDQGDGGGEGGDGDFHAKSFQLRVNSIFVSQYTNE